MLAMRARSSSRSSFSLVPLWRRRAQLRTASTRVTSGLKKLAKSSVYVCRCLSNIKLPSALEDLINLTYLGNYPAHDPGVLLYRMKSSPTENRAWFVDGQDVVLIARLLRNGVYPTERIVSLGGSGVSQAKFHSLAEPQA